jgi:hypothetical protein
MFLLKQWGDILTIKHGNVRNYYSKRYLLLFINNITSIIVHNGFWKCHMFLTKYYFRIQNIAVQKETMMDVITMKECETRRMEILTDRTVQIHRVHGNETIKLRVHICRKFVRRREKTETINPERSILVRIVFQLFMYFQISC